MRDPVTRERIQVAGNLQEPLAAGALQQAPPLISAQPADDIVVIRDASASNPTTEETNFGEPLTDPGHRAV